MKLLRLAILGFTFSSFSLAVNKDLVALQRDLEAKIDALQQVLNAQGTQLANLNGILTAMQNDTRHTSDQVAGMQEQIRNAVASSLAPVTGLGNKVESTSEDVRALRDALADLSGRLERMDAKITDLKNQIQIMQNPPPAPGANGAPGTGPPGQQGPPAGMSADTSFTDARRDMQTGNTDLSYQEFQQYLKYFPDTERAADAQYYIGEISFNRGDYKAAVDAFDAVLERYPRNPRSADAALMKGMALAKDGQRVKAMQELRSVIRDYPNTDDARKAAQALRDPRLFPSAGGTTARKRPS